jgi:hypothetical protein
VFFFRFFGREGKSFVCFLKPCEAALVQDEEEEEEEEEEENKRGVSDGGKAEGTERSNRRRNGSRSSTNLGRLGGGIGETVSTVLRGILFSLHLVLRVFFGCSSVLFDMLSCFVYASAV